MHDLIEGIFSQDLLGIIRIMSRLGWFSIEEYNLRLQQFNFKAQDASDRPQNVPTSINVKKLCGKACSLWVHMRNFLLIIRKYVRMNHMSNPILLLALKLHSLTEVLD